MIYYLLSVSGIAKRSFCSALILTGRRVVVDFEGVAGVEDVTDTVNVSHGGSCRHLPVVDGMVSSASVEQDVQMNSPH